MEPDEEQQAVVPRAALERVLRMAREMQRLVAAGDVPPRPFYQHTGESDLRALTDALNAAPADDAWEHGPAWRSVPVEPTAAMVNEGYRAFDANGGSLLKAWRYMVLAAPKEPAPSSARGG